ncbi:regulatory protein RecX [Phaeospirillum tilakii]|uniref:Regulatory protein RecX n=1 Tax=Phaeospirillum tilakii TaxID=741673 RepID=A0ABW5CAE1_9PROT
MTGRAAPPLLTTAYLEAAALHYLERFASSRANLRRVLLTKARRSLAHHGGEREEAEALIEAVIARLAGLGYLDDAAYAEMKTASLIRRGGSRRAIQAKLAAKGVAAETVRAALEEFDPEAERAAAWALARRRRLGPFRPPAARAAHRDRDLAALARAGFPGEIARAVIDAETTEADPADDPTRDMA